MHLRDRFSERVQLDSSVYYVNSDNGVDKIGLIKPTPEFAFVDDPGRLKQEIWLTQSTAGIDLLQQWHSELQLGFTKYKAYFRLFVSSSQYHKAKIGALNQDVFVYYLPSIFRGFIFKYEICLLS
jgi:hypothetical protein